MYKMSWRGLEKVLRRIFLESHAEVEEWIKPLCAGGYTVVLFGSRARGSRGLTAIGISW